MIDLTAKAKAIRLLILDVDGIMTTGVIYYHDSGEQMKGFNILDGYGIRLMQEAGIPVAVISGKNSPCVANRLAQLKVQHVYLGHEDKLPIYNELKEKLNLADAEIAYMGDELIDLPILCRVGLAVTVPNAASVMHDHVDFTTTHKGGKGAVREVCELILNAQGKYEPIVQSFLKK